MNEFSSVAWFPLLNHIRRGYAQEPYSRWTVLKWTIILPLVGFLMLLTYWGARLLAQLYAAIKNRPPQPATSEAMTLYERVKFKADQSANMPNAVDGMLDKFAADIFSYVNSAGGTFSLDRKVPDDLRNVAMLSVASTTS